MGLSNAYNDVGILFDLGRQAISLKMAARNFLPIRIAF